MVRQYKAFKVTGVANDTAEDKGITSTKAESVHLLGLLLFVTGHAGNLIKADLERKTRLELYDYHLDTDESSGSTNVQRSTTKLNYLEVDEDIPLGATFAVKITCGATAKDLYGAYVYEAK